jgi:hypothetical protein
MKALFVLAFATFLGLPLHAQIIQGVQPKEGIRYDLKSGQELVLNIDGKRVDFVCDINPYKLDPSFQGHTELLQSDDRSRKSRKFFPHSGDPESADGDGNYPAREMGRDFLNWVHGYDPYFHVNCLSTEEYIKNRKCFIDEGSDGFGGKQQKLYVRQDSFYSGGTPWLTPQQQKLPLCRRAQECSAERKSQDTMCWFTNVNSWKKKASASALTNQSDF